MLIISHTSVSFVVFSQIFYRAEFRAVGGYLPPFQLLSRPQQPQRDIWGLQRESEVSAAPLQQHNVFYLVTLWLS